MLLHLRFTMLLPLFLLALSLSCAVRPVPDPSVAEEELVEMIPPPYRIAIASSREPASLSGFPDGMVVAVELGTGRLGSSSPTWKALMELADDETVHAIVVSKAPQGTAALFMDLKQRRPGLVLIALLPEEPPLVIQAAADTVLDFDHVMRAYNSVLMASRMGRSQIVSLSMPGTSEDWRLNSRETVLRAASADMGLAFKSLAVGPESLEKALKELGTKAGANSLAGVGTGAGGTGVAIVANDGRLASNAFRLADATGALFIELDRPEDGYAGFVADAEPSNGPTSEDPVRVMIDTARKVPGRPGLTLVWPGELASLMELGALLLAKSILDGKQASEVNLAAVMNAVWPTGQWHSSHFVDPQSGVRARNHLVVGSDPYLVGRSYLSSEAVNMPVKYRQVAGQ